MVFVAVLPSPSSPLSQVRRRLQEMYDEEEAQRRLKVSQSDTAYSLPRRSIHFSRFLPDPDPDPDPALITITNMTD